MKRLSLDDFSYETDIKSKEKRQVIDNIKGAEQLLNRHRKLNEELMKELSVSIIWFDSFDEIPEILNRVNNE